VIADRNKTALTHAVTNACCAWLCAHGFKPVELEVPTASRWIADLGAMILPTQTELIRLKLLRSAPKWHLDTTEAYSSWRHTRDGLLRYMCCIVEVKTTRSDFQKDHKWKKSIPTDLAYLAIPKGLLTEAEWPADWGILEWSESHGLRCRRVPTLNYQTATAQRDFVCALAMRQFNHVNFEAERDRAKQERLHRACELPVARTFDALRAVLTIAKGQYYRQLSAEDSVQCILQNYNIKNMPESLIAELVELWGSFAPVI
jgi:hypothetical protein